MKEGKTTKTTAKKRTNNNSRNHTSRSVKEAPKVREVKTVEVEENFLEDDGDKRLIVFIAIAILVIVGTVIGLLVGCQKENTNEPEKPEDDIKVPTKEEDKKDDKEVYNYEKPLPVVRKVTKKTTTKAETNQNTEEETTTHNVTFIINDTNEVVSVEDGKEAETYVPSGYTNCKYYTDEEKTNEYEFSSVSEDANVYMTCELIEYSVVYDVESENPTTYTVEDNDTTLIDVKSDNGVFDGWYTDSTEGVRITKLNKDIVSYANENNVINLYARFTTNSDEVISDNETEETETVVDRNETTTPVVGETTDETGENEEGKDDTTGSETTVGNGSTNNTQGEETTNQESQEEDNSSTNSEDNSSETNDDNENSNGEVGNLTEVPTTSEDEEQNTTNQDSETTKEDNDSSLPVQNETEVQPLEPSTPVETEPNTASITTSSVHETQVQTNVEVRVVEETVEEVNE